MRKDILKFIEEYILANGYAPTMGEIAKAVFTTDRNVCKHIHTMIDMGVLVTRAKERSQRAFWVPGLIVVRETNRHNLIENPDDVPDTDRDVIIKIQEIGNDRQFRLIGCYNEEANWQIADEYCYRRLDRGVFRVTEWEDIKEDLNEC